MKDNWKSIIAVLGSLALFAGSWGTVYAFYDDFRPWPSRAEFRTVAEAAFSAKLDQLNNHLIQARYLLDKCDVAPDCPEITKIRYEGEIIRLESQIDSLKQQMESVNG